MGGGREGVREEGRDIVAMMQDDYDGYAGLFIVYMYSTCKLRSGNVKRVVYERIRLRDMKNARKKI